MIRILISFDLKPGVAAEYHSFVVNEGLPFWERQEGILAVRGFRNLAEGSPAIVSEVDCESIEVARTVLESEAYARVIQRQARFVINRSVLLLEPTGRSRGDR